MRSPVLTHCVLLVTLTTAATSQTPPSQTYLADLHRSKLSLPFLKNADWILDFTAAKAAATSRGKLIFAYFTRSDERCQESILMECGTLAEAGFKSFSERVVPFCHITTRVKGHKDPTLFADKGGKEFPMLAFLDARGAVVYRVKGEELADIEKGLSELEELESLRKRVADGDRSARFGYLRKRLDLGCIAYPEAKVALRKAGKLTKLQRKELALLLLECEMLHIAGLAKTPKARIKAGEKFFRMKKKGLQPTRNAIRPFWRMILCYAEKREDVDLYEEAVDTLDHEFEKIDLEAARATLRRMQLKKMKKRRCP